MPNFRPRKRRQQESEALSEAQLGMLAFGPNPFVWRPDTWDAPVIAVFGSIDAFREAFNGHRDSLFALTAPNKPWAYWVLEGGIKVEPPPAKLRIVKRPPSALRLVPHLADTRQPES